MKIKSLLYLIIAIINYRVYCIAAPSLEGPFYCGKDIAAPHAIEKAKATACINLSDSPWWGKFPAAFDASKIFDIKDVILFSWPLDWKQNHKFMERSAGNQRVIIDSNCKLIGIVNRIDDSYQKCFQPLYSQFDPSLPPELSFDSTIKHYGTDCNGFVFFDNEMQKAYESLRSYFFTREILTNGVVPKGFLKTHILQEFDNQKIWSWPVVFRSDKHPPEKIPKTKFRVTLDHLGKKRGIIHQIRGEWRRCNNIFYKDENPSTALKEHKTPLGEDFFDVNNDFLCGDQTITAIMINSHMQAACPRVQALLKLGNTKNLKYPWSPPNIEYQSKPTWYWPIRLSENHSQKGKDAQKAMVKDTDKAGTETVFRKHQLILLASNCEFLGIYYFVDAQKMECQKLQAPVLSLGSQTEAATPEPHPKKRKFTDSPHTLEPFRRKNG